MDAPYLVNALELVRAVIPSLTRLSAAEEAEKMKHAMWRLAGEVAQLVAGTPPAWLLQMNVTESLVGLVMDTAWAWPDFLHACASAESGGVWVHLMNGARQVTSPPGLRFFVT